MRAIYLIFPLILFLISCKPSGKSAAKYNNTVVRYQSRVGVLQQELFAVFKVGKAEEMQQVLDKLRYELRAVSDSINTMPSFDGKDDFKRNALKYVDEMKSVVDGECTVIVKMYQLPDTAYHAEDEKKVQELILSINNKTSKALTDLKVNQEKFAEEYNFEIAK